MPLNPEGPQSKVLTRESSRVLTRVVKVRKQNSLGAAQLLPGLMVLDRLVLHGTGLQVRRVDVLQGGELVMERVHSHRCQLSVRHRTAGFCPPAGTGPPGPVEPANSKQTGKPELEKQNPGSVMALFCPRPGPTAVRTAPKENGTAAPPGRFLTHLDLQSVADGQSRVLQRLDDRGVRVGELGVLPHQSDGALLQQPVRPATTSEHWSGAARRRRPVPSCRVPPVGHLPPLGQHGSGLGLDGHVEPAAQVAHHTLLLQQQRDSVDG